MVPMRVYFWTWKLSMNLRWLSIGAPGGGHPAYHTKYSHCRPGPRPGAPTENLRFMVTMRDRMSWKLSMNPFVVNRACGPPSHQKSHGKTEGA